VWLKRSPIRKPRELDKIKIKINVVKIINIAYALNSVTSSSVSAPYFTAS